jgi:signal transduction histidine kinase
LAVFRAVACGLSCTSRILIGVGGCGIVRERCSIYSSWGIPAVDRGARFAGTVHRSHLVILDAVIPALVGAVIVVAEALHGAGSVRPAAIAFGLAAAAVLWGRHRWPALTLAVSGALVVILLHIDGAAGVVAVLAPAVALYTLALRRGRPAQLLAGIAAVAAVIGAETLHSGRPTVLQTAGHVLLVAIPLLAAEAARTHRSYLSLLEERLELAEHSREQEAQRRAEQERMRIARELHDVVAHTLTEINVQAGAAAERTVLSDARAALERIEDSSRDAIAELRAILGVLRDAGDRPAARTPTPGIEKLTELVDRARDTALQVDLTIEGERPARVSDASSLAAYRIVQESLTNARRHAPGAPVRVRLSFGATDLSLAVENLTDERASNGGSAGVGIKGMLERASAIGGTLHAGPTSHGFAVTAELPYQPA